MAIDPNSTTTSSSAATTTATAPASTTTVAANPTPSTIPARPFINPPPSRPISPLQQPQLHPHHHHHPTTTAAYSAPQPHLYTAIRTPVPPHPYPNSQLVKSPNDPSSPAAASPAPHGIPYPVASSGRGFIPRAAVRPPDQTVTVANPGGYPPRPVTAASTGFHHMVRPLQNLQQHLYHPHLGSAVGAPIKGVPVSLQSKVTPSSSIPDCNGHKDMRDKSRDDNLTIVKDRKVRITEGASLYALCRSWLKNGIPEETQPQYGDGLRSLPKPSPIPMASGNQQKNKSREEEDNDGGEEEDEEAAKHRSVEDLLKGHVKRAKRVRARLREVRLKRIARYKSRLALLLPPLVEQFRNDAATGT